MKKNSKKEILWNKQVNALRDPVEILTGSYIANGISPKSLQYKVSDSFISLIGKMEITILVSREYEHLVMALKVSKGKIRQSFLHLPHPSGIAVDRKTNSVYIASTRNPNTIWELKPIKKLLFRTDENFGDVSGSFLMPSRSKYFAGAYYYHDLAIIDGDLYANSVGHNGIVRVNFNGSSSDQLIWWPKVVEDKSGNVKNNANYIQLNSIAAGDSLEESFFSASGDKISSLRPGNLNYPVDKKGVIFSGKTREVIAAGLTRPHSARLYKKQIWVANSGYGEVGFIEKNKFIPILKLPGWTRGLFIHQDVLFIGVSRVLPRFKQYAPGLDLKFQSCGIYAINLKTGEVIGSLVWPYGSQIFAVDFINNNIADGFIFEKIRSSTAKQKNIFYRYQL